ncbi:MAG: hypothetical protein J6Y07_00125 [Alphaproteobacteria bacterium]|nr:hypothetical protein [Alphaproteobacteria bacterium]
MKGFRLILLLVIMWTGAGFCGDGNHENALIYIEPAVARIVIERYFAHMASEYSLFCESELSDGAILKNVIDAYNNMLGDTGGYVSVSGVNNVCDVAFKDLEPKGIDGLMMLKTKRRIVCLDFVKDLVATEIGEKDCQYSIKKVSGSQMRIRYTDKEKGGGFIRKGGTIAWRFFNPGALRDSPYRCVLINTKPGGKYAAFDSYEKGRFAIRWLLENAEKYNGKTPREAIPMYAPKFENNTKKYIRDLIILGVDVDKKMSELSEYEWEKFLDAIEQIEGWNDQGVIEEI